MKKFLLIIIFLSFAFVNAQTQKHCLIDSIYKDLQLTIPRGWIAERVNTYSIRITKKDSVCYSFFAHDLNPDYSYETTPPADGKSEVELLFNFKKGKEKWTDKKLEETKALNDSIKQKMRRLRPCRRFVRDSTGLANIQIMPSYSFTGNLIPLPFLNSPAFTVFEEENLFKGIDYFYAEKVSAEGIRISQWQFDTDKEKLLESCHKLISKRLTGK
jgi:hypothetical protein